MIKKAFLFVFLFLVSMLGTLSLININVFNEFFETKAEIQTTVVLIPDADGSVGVVSVSNNAGTQTIDKAYTSVDLRNVEDKAVKKKVDKEAILAEFKSALSAKPNPVTNYVLYFITGSNELVQESKELLTLIIEDISQREVYEATIVGHTDSRGEADLNYILGLNRAIMLKEMLVKRFPKSSKIKTVSHGEGNPLVATDDNVDEPKNRRVEIQIK